MGRSPVFAQAVALGLVGIGFVLMASYVIAALANEFLVGLSSSSGPGGLANQEVLGGTLTLASSWSLPQVIAFFIFGPLALAAWLSTLGNVPGWSRRAPVLLVLELVLSVLTILGAPLSVAGRLLQLAPSEDWSGFVLTLCLSFASLCLGVLGCLTAQWMRGRYPFRNDEGAPNE